MNLLLQVQHLLPRCKIFSFRYTQNHNIFIKHLVLFVYPIQQIILIDSSSNCLCMYLLLLYFLVAITVIITLRVHFSFFLTEQYAL